MRWPKLDRDFPNNRTFARFIKARCSDDTFFKPIRFQGNPSGQVDKDARKPMPWPRVCHLCRGCGESRPPMDPQTASVLATTYQLTVTLAGTGSGTVTSGPAGINCKPTCTASFAAGTQLKLTPLPAKGSYFAGWSRACRGTSACTITMNSDLAVRATVNISQTVKVLNHIIFMA